VLEKSAHVLQIPLGPNFVFSNSHFRTNVIEMDITALDKQLAQSYLRYLKQHIRAIDDNQISSLRDCFHTPDVIRLKKNQKLYALGDLHGDFEVLWYSLLKANLVDNDGNWTGGDSVVIQLGDMLDGARVENRPGYPYVQSAVPYGGEKMLVNFLKNLHLQAVEVGGMVVTMLGNHDVNRLLAEYDDAGNSLYPVNNNYYLKDTESNNSSPGIDPVYGPTANNFMSVDNRTDFDHNRSLSSGFHRQLLSSCSSKLLIKVIWEETGDETIDVFDNANPTFKGPIGVLASHGEKIDVFIFDQLGAMLTTQFEEVDQEYHLGFGSLVDFAAYPDHLLAVINSLFSFFLRKYQKVDFARTKHPFGKLMFDFLDKIGQTDNYNFLWCYVGHPHPGYTPSVCQSSAVAMARFGLDPLRSTCLSAHSGSMSGPSYVIKMNQNGWCRGINPPEDTHNNTIIMTDITATRAYQEWRRKPNRYYIKPQIVELSVNGQRLEPRLIMCDNDVLEEPDQHVRLAAKLNDPTNLRLRELAGGRRKR
jgi:hypothetical protein